MASLLVLVASWIVVRLAGLLGWAAVDSWHPSLRVALALMFLFTGLSHFGRRIRPGMIAMVPPRLPRPELLVTVTGVLELLGAVGLLVPMTSGLAAAALALLLVALFPANIHAAKNNLRLGGRPVMPILPRTIMQLGFLCACVAVLVGH